MKNQSKSLFPEDVFNLEKRFEQYLELVKLDKAKMSAVQLSETKRAFFGGVGTALMAYINDTYELSEHGAMMAIDSMQRQVAEFMAKEAEEQKIKPEQVDVTRQTTPEGIKALSGDVHAHLVLVVPSHSNTNQGPHFEMGGCTECMIASLAAAMIQVKHFKDIVILAHRRSVENLINENTGRFIDPKLN